MLDGVFWSRPSEDDDARPTDPLGLDAMREELSDRPVPCLTGRTWSHEEFFWSLVFLRWAEEEKRTEEAQVQRFLSSIGNAVSDCTGRAADEMASPA